MLAGGLGEQSPPSADGSGNFLLADARRRFRQLSAPIAAKAVEDTAFYRYGRLLSRNDVGFDAARFASAVPEFHAAMAVRAATWPAAMLATATHDHKRGEDVRARLAVLSALPGEWIETAERWRASGAAADSGIDGADEYMFYQMLVGAWPDGLAADDPAGMAAYRDRLWSWMEKALREAKLRSSWTAPDQTYEGVCRAWLERRLDPGFSSDFLGDVRAFVARIAPAGEANALVQTFLRCTAPGIPDCYQGCEFADLSLVDPDNRRPVDYAARAAAIDGAPRDFNGIKQDLIARLLGLRREHPDLWSGGGWEPVEATGERAGHVLGFVRRVGSKAMLGAVALRCAHAIAGSGRHAPEAAWWGGTRLAPDGPEAAELFRTLPLHLSILEAGSRKAVI